MPLARLQLGTRPMRNLPNRLLQPPSPCALDRRFRLYVAGSPAAYDSNYLAKGQYDTEGCEREECGGVIFRSGSANETPNTKDGSGADIRVLWES